MVWIKLHNPVCILVSICETCLSYVCKWIKKQKRKQNHSKFKAFLDVMRTQTDSIYRNIYSQVLYTDRHTHTVAQPSFPPLLSVSSSANKHTTCRAHMKPQLIHMHAKVHTRTRVHQPSMSRYTGEALARLWSMLWISLMFSLM